MNGLVSRVAGLRHNVVTPGAPTGMINPARLPSISMPDMPPT